MTPLHELLLERVRAQGPMPFAAYMSLALYHPRHGYYASGAERTGFRGHFLTAPEVDPAYGELWTRGFEQIWTGCGRPGRFEVVEAGPGEGSFAAAVLESASGDFAAALAYRLVERIASLQKRQRKRLPEDAPVAWSSSLDEAPGGEAGVVFANEVLDNLPVHLVEKRGGKIQEVCVEADGDRLIETLRPPASEHLENVLSHLDVDLPEGHRLEIPLAGESFARRAAGLFERGAVLFVDYGDDARGLASRPRGSLLCYSDEGVDDQPLDRPGEKDITAHANWTSVSRALAAEGLEVFGPLPQRDVLRDLGVGELDRRLRAEHEEALAVGEGGRAVAALSRRQALGVLSDPAGLGSLGVVIGARGIDAPAFARESAGADSSGPRARNG